MSKYTVEQWRKVRGLTQEEVAQALQISLNNFSAKEQGKRDFKFNEMILFANLVGVQTSDISPVYNKISEID